MSNKSLDFINYNCYTNMKYNNSLDLSKYGTSGICPNNIYKKNKEYIYLINKFSNKNNPCKLDHGKYIQETNYRNKLLSCHTYDNNKRYGYYDLPCLKSTYKNTNYYNLNKNLFHFYESHNN